MAQSNLLNLVQGTLEKGSVLTMSTATPIVEAMEFTQISGNSYAYNIVNDLLVTEHRELGSDVLPQEMLTEKKVVPLKILTNSVQVDRALGVMQNLNDIQAESQQLAMTSSGKALEKFVLSRLDEELVATTSGKKFTGALTIDLLDDTLDYVRGIREGTGLMFVNPKMKRDLTRLFKAEGYNQGTIEAFGRKVIAYDNIPVMVSDDMTDGHIFVVKFGLDAVHGVTNQGLVCYNYDKGVHKITDTELLYNVITKTKSAFAKIEITA